MPSIYQPRRPRASPLWQLVHHGWNDFLANYEQQHRKTLGPLHPNTVATVQSFLRCGDLASGFTRLQCPDCGHERLLAFTCKGRHFEIFKAPDFIAAAIDHIPPKGQHTVRYYGVYSNKSRGQSSPIRDRIIRPSQPKPPPENPTPVQILLIPAPPKRRARDMRPLWRDLILKVWGGDPLLCPCCNGTMKVTGTMIRHEEIELFLRLHGLWQGIIHLPRPPPPPFDIDTMEPIEPPWQAIKEWIADAPLWPCRLQDPPPDLVFINRRLNAAGAFPMTSRI